MKKSHKRRPPHPHPIASPVDTTDDEIPQRERLRQAGLAAGRDSGPDEEKGDGDAPDLSPATDAIVRRRRSDGTFLTGPGRAASLAALSRADGVRKRRHIVTKTLLDCTTPEAVQAHFARLDQLIRHGKGSDAISAFRTLYSFLTTPAVPPTQDQAGLGGGELPLHAPVIVMIEPEPR